MYDMPQTPFDRHRNAGALTDEQIGEMLLYQQRLTPVRLSRSIITLGDELAALAKRGSM